MKLVYRCLVPGCKNTEEDEFLKFYTLPYKDQEVCKEWIKRIGDAKLQNMPIVMDNTQTTYKICEIHFHYMCKTGLNAQLHDNSLPTLHLPIVKGIQLKTNCFYMSPTRTDYIATNSTKEKPCTQVETCTEICRICFSKGILYDIAKSIYNKKDHLITIIKYLVPDYDLNSMETRENICLECVKLVLTSYLTVIRIETALDVFSELYSATSLTKTSLNLAYQSTIDMKSILEDCDLKISSESSKKYSAKNIEVINPIALEAAPPVASEKAYTLKELLNMPSSSAATSQASETLDQIMSACSKIDNNENVVKNKPTEAPIKFIKIDPAKYNLVKLPLPKVIPKLEDVSDSPRITLTAKQTAELIKLPNKAFKDTPKQVAKSPRMIDTDFPQAISMAQSKRQHMSKQMPGLTSINNPIEIASTSKKLEIAATKKNIPVKIYTNKNKKVFASPDKSTVTFDNQSIKQYGNKRKLMNRERIIELVDEDDKELLKEEAIELVLIKEENSVFPEDNIDAYQGETETIAADLMCESDYDDEKEVFVKQEHISDIHMFDVKSNYISCYEPQCSFKCATVEEYGKHIGTHKHIIALSCNYCDMVCKGMKQYYSHLKTHGQQPRKRIARQPRARKVLLPKSSIECPQCGLVAKDKQFLAVHMGRYHGPLVDCPICHKKKRKVLMAAHLRTHKNQLSCTECNITFESTKLFNRHELLQHPKICLICSKKFSVVRYLRKHIMRHGDAIKDIECEHCHRMFKSEASIRCHLRYRAKNNDVCMPPFCKETYGRIRRSRQVPIICPICGKAVMDYVTHVRRHTSQKEYKCSECPYESKYPTNYRRHMLTHSGDKPFLCTDCGLSFIQKTMLDSHARQHEICEEPIKCKYCELTFPTKFDFKVHRESHGIGKHTKLLYGSTSDADVVSYARMRREFICSICDKAWASRAMLQSHLRAHSDVRPFRCDICPSTFKFKFALRVHTENVHEDRRPFSCKVCKKAFRHELALRDHARTHTGERLECGRCDKTFASSSNRSKHLREVHNVRFRTIYTTKIIKNKLHSTS